MDSELARSFLRVPQYACGSLAVHAECSPRAAIRVQIFGCACGMFVSFLLPSPPSPPAENPPLVATAKGRPKRRRSRCALRAQRNVPFPPVPPAWDHLLRARNVLRVAQYACASLAARAHKMFLLRRITQADRCLHMQVIGRPSPDLNRNAHFLT